MIVFDQECNFMGIGRSLLDFLGYSNLRDFKDNITNINELFDLNANISNASWIQFLLDKNISFQNLLLKHKSGKKIQVFASCEEIYLSTSFDENKIIYRISFSQVNKNQYQTKEISEDFVSLIPPNDSNLLNSWNNQNKEQTTTNIFLKAANTLENESYNEKKPTIKTKKAQELVEKVVEKKDIEEEKVIKEIKQPEQEINNFQELEPNNKNEQIPQNSISISPLVMQEYILEAALNLGLSELDMYNLVQEFIEHSNSLEEVLEEAFVFNSTDEILNITSELQGISDNLGLAPLTQILKEIRNSDKTTAQEYLKEYQDIIKIIKDLLLQRGIQ